jgi:hypothetical protein
MPRNAEPCAKQKPGVANRFFGSQQDLAMQGLRNQGALGVAQENAKGDIARNEAAAKFQQAQLGIKAFEAGMPGAQPQGPGAAPLPTTTTGTGQPGAAPASPVAQLPPAINQEVREQAISGDPEGAKNKLKVNGLSEEQANDVVGNLIGDPAYGRGFWDRPIFQGMPGQVQTRGEAVQDTLFPFLKRNPSGKKVPPKAPEKPQKGVPYVTRGNPFGLMGSALGF